MSFPSVVVCDLDGTIVHSARRRTVEATVVVEQYEGRDVGFMTSAGWDALTALQQRSCFIPVTARTEQQYRRLRFPQRPKFAVVACGGRVLIDDTVDEHWHDHAGRTVAESGATCSEVVEELARVELAEPPRIGDDVFVYARTSPGASIMEFARWCRERRWTTVEQDGRLYALPNGIGKVHALARVRQLTSADVVVGAGDGLMDAELLSALPTAFTPELGPLWKSGWRDGRAVPGYDANGATTLLECILNYLN